MIWGAAAMVAERLVCKGLARLKLKEADLLDMPKSAEEKKAIVTLLKARTHAGNKWIVTRQGTSFLAGIIGIMRFCETGVFHGRLKRFSNRWDFLAGCAE